MLHYFLRRRREEWYDSFVVPDVMNREVDVLDLRSPIPWIHGLDWEQVVGVITASTEKIGSAREDLFNIAREITSVYYRVNPELEYLADLTCSACVDVCCTRATVWYDLKDLLYLYFSAGFLPTGQIYRTEDEVCCHLTTTGCELPRLQRPFICSWYICSKQKEKVSVDQDGQRKLFSEIEKIKDLRKSLETSFIDLTCPIK